MAVFKAFIDDTGHIGIEDRQAFKAHRERLKGQAVLVKLEKAPKRQGSQSMRYYRGVVIPDIARACGYSDPDDFESVHDAMAWKFLRLPDGEFGQPMRRSTAKHKMSQDEIMDYISQVILFAETSIPDCRVRRPDDVDMETVVDEEWS